MNSTDILKAFCRWCNRAIHKHAGGITWSHDFAHDFYSCGHFAEPKDFQLNERNNDVQRSTGCTE